jgi:1-deoxy-D-xylulose 5-phosphate reductoisomerase
MLLKLAITVESDIIYPKDVAFIERKAVVRKKEERLEAALHEEDVLNGMVSLEDKKAELERKLVVKAFDVNCSVSEQNKGQCL